MAVKEVYDVRGRQWSILRVGRFDKGALLHMLAYRTLIFVAPLAAVVIAVSLFIHVGAVELSARIAVLVVWLLFTPQLFAAIKAFSVVRSGGFVFGSLNESFVKARMKKKAIYHVYEALPYIAMIAWDVGFVVLLLAWFL